MRITRIFADPRGISRFADIDVPAGSVRLFAEIPAFEVNRMEYETGRGEVRRFAAGEVALAEDTTGAGHVTRFAVGKQRFLHTPVPDDRPV